jgi:lysozyme
MIGDGMITVGWGHAEPVSKSKFKVGQVITKEEATKLLKEDLKTAADGVRKIFKQWEDDGIERKITQDQFDALVSMCFNMGIGGLRRSEVISLIKKGNYEGAGERIKTQSVRKREADLFLSYLDKKDMPVKTES